MPSPQDTNERRQAIWPWLLMPLVVLLVAYTLHNFQAAAKSNAQSRAHAEETAEP
jgi:cbb3-type cytochrome oxidase subunit 3